jgi:hypothetical protein
MHKEVRTFLAILLAAAAGALLVLVAACNNSQSGFSGNVGNTPNGPPITSYRILGTVGTPFSATVSNARSSWLISGNVPLSTAIVNNLLPVRIIANKLSSDRNLLSVQVFNGAQVVDVGSTTAPFGTVSIGKLETLSPPANPDLRINVTGPAGERFAGLIEDQTTAFFVEDRAPATYFFDSPDGTIVGQFFQIQNFGGFTINMTLNGNVIATANGGPNVTIVQP